MILLDIALSRKNIYLLNRGRELILIIRIQPSEHNKRYNVEK